MDMLFVNRDPNDKLLKLTAMQMTRSIMDLVEPHTLHSDQQQLMKQICDKVTFGLETFARCKELSECNGRET